MLFFNVILLCVLSTSLSFILPSKLRSSTVTRNVFSSVDIGINNGDRDSNVEIFNPFAGSPLLKETDASISTSYANEQCNRIDLNEGSNDKSDVNSGSFEYSKTIPALSLLAVLGMAGSADAADVIAAPLHGFQLYARYFLAGGLCCSLSHGIAVPFDVVKTRLQTSVKGEFESTDVISVARTIVDQDGLGMLYKGLGPTLVGYFIQGSLKYGFYEIFKPLVCGELYHLDLILPDSTTGRIVTFMISGFFAEFIGSSFLAPFEAARIRLVTNPAFASGVVDCIAKIIKEEQASALFRGLPAVFAKQIPFTVIQLASFESITTAIYNYLSRTDSDFDYSEISKYKYAISGFSALIAAFLSSIASQPGDTLLSAVNQSTKKGIMCVGSSSSVAVGDNAKSDKKEKEKNYVIDSFSNVEVETKMKTQKIVKSNVDVLKMTSVDTILESPLVVMRNTIDELGFKGLFKGTKARLLHVSFYVVIQFLIYDFVKQSVGLPITGAH